MFTAIKDNKIIAISDTDSTFPCLVCDAIASDPEHTTSDYAEVNGEFVLKTDAKAIRKIKDEQIAELKQKLADTDYIDNKLVDAMVRDDGSLEVLKQKYSKIIADRQVWRTTIDELEE